MPRLSHKETYEGTVTNVDGKTETAYLRYNKEKGGFSLWRNSQTMYAKVVVATVAAFKDHGVTWKTGKVVKEIPAGNEEIQTVA